MSLSRLVYDIFIRVYAAGIRLASAFSPKARLWTGGRKDWRGQLRKGLSGKQVDLWIHCASLGEFEQGRPVIEALRQSFPGLTILLSFYSPSGYEIRKHYAFASHVSYLPLDTRKNARDFMELANPRMAIFVKYEFWMHFLTELHQRAIPILLISAIFRPTQLFFSWYGGSFLRLLSYYEKIFVQDQASAAILETNGVQSVIVSGDTRFDRVLKIAAEAKEVPGIAHFLQDAPAVVAGSTWPGDETVLASCVESMPKWIIAPHEVSEARLQQLEKRFGASLVRYSALLKDPGKYEDRRILAIDNIGMLSALYRYGKIAFIGGGFDHGIHNVLEAAVYGVPVLFGPHHHKFREAADLIRYGAAFPVETAPALLGCLEKLRDEPYRKICGARASRYVREQAGATGKILDFIQEKRFFTSI